MEHQQQQQQQPNQQSQGGVPGPTGRRLHIAHRRSPSELTPLMSMFSSPGSKSIFPHFHLGDISSSEADLDDHPNFYICLPSADTITGFAYSHTLPDLYANHAFSL
jgi:hypothetical protein